MEGNKHLFNHCIIFANWFPNTRVWKSHYVCLDFQTRFIFICSLPGYKEASMWPKWGQAIGLLPQVTSYKSAIWLSYFSGARGAPWVSKFGNPLIRKILVLTSAYVRPSVCTDPVGGWGESQDNPTGGGRMPLFSCSWSKQHGGWFLVHSLFNTVVVTFLEWRLMKTCNSSSWKGKGLGLLQSRWRMYKILESLKARNPCSRTYLFFSKLRRSGKNPVTFV